MATQLVRQSTLDRLLDDFAACLNHEAADKVAAFSLRPEITETLSTFAEQSGLETLSESDRQEYETIVRAANLIMSILTGSRSFAFMTRAATTGTSISKRSRGSPSAER